MAKDAMRFTNRLGAEKSPYLKQHAGNPVEWYPWKDEALEKAKEEDKPIILSIGYSSCHWCHVMERESFEDIETAKIMNENFINIKVDREERPDLDSLYMKAVQVMTGHAGWPLTVFASPDGVPFYGGSYFPPDDRHGLPSFKKVLLAASLAYKKNRGRVNMVKSDIEEMLGRKAAVSQAVPGEDAADAAFDAARMFFDHVHGGFGRDAKFPHAMFLEFLLDYHRRTGEDNALQMVKKSLSSMAMGGIYDHAGGGFHRYSVDEMWEIPHFEKMLYDNALLARLYTLSYDRTGAESFKDVSIETLDYLMREMRSPEGGFYSAQDADVNGEEGAYYLWGYDEIKAILGGRADRFIDYFQVTEQGNYEGRNTLRINPEVKDAWRPAGGEIKEMKALLLASRKERKAPERDLKIITGWNGLAVSAFSQAFISFGRGDYLETAARCANFLLSSLRDKKGRLMRYYLAGAADVKANLEDYALLGNGFLSIYGAAKEKRWLEEAKRLAESMVEIFYDVSEGLFYDTGKDQERLFIRERDLFDNDLPSGNSAAAGFLLNLSEMPGGDKRYRGMAEEILRSVEGIVDAPLSYGRFLCVLENMLGWEKAKAH